MNDFSDLTDSAYEQERKKALAATAPLAVSVASTKSPDAAAKAMSLSRRYNVPPAVAEQFAEDYSARAKQEDAQNVMARAPKLGSWIAEQPERADLVHDDLDNLGGIEQTIGRLASYTMGARPDGGLPVDLTKMARSLAAGFGPRVGAGAYGAAAYPAEALGLDGIGARMRELQRSSQAVADKVAGVDPEAGLIERGIMSGMQSAGQTMATLPLGFMRGAAVTGEALMLGAMGALTFGQTYGKGRDDGLSVGQAGFYGMQDATVEVVTEKFLGAAKLVGDAKAGMGAAKLFVRDIAREIPGEMGATLWQNFNEWANLNPDKTLNEWLSEQPEALAETIIATIVGGGAQVGAIRGVQKIMGDTARRQAQADEAEQHASQAEQLAGLLAASKTAGRDATTLREFIAQVADEEGDAPTQFYVDGEQLLNVLNQSGMSRDEFAALAPTAAAQLDEALTGGMVRLPVGEFAAAGEKITAPLIDHLRASEDAPTRAEAREFMAGEGKALQEEVERELQKRGDDATFRDSVAGIQTRFEAELNAAGRFTPEVNKGYATLLSNFFGATAARLGMAPDELLAKYELRVQAKASDGRRVMNQVETDTPAFRNWFGDSKVVDEAGAPLVVYHGTARDFESFDPTKFGANTRATNDELGFFFTSKPFLSDNYAELAGKGGWNNAEPGSPVVYPVHLSIKNPKTYKTATEFYRDGDARAGNHGAWREDLIAQGYDGVVVRGDFEEVIVFDPKQVKSAIGNSGAFDGSDPNILNQSAQEERKAKIIELRKRESVLKSLQECLGG